MFWLKIDVVGHFLVGSKVFFVGNILIIILNILAVFVLHQNGMCQFAVDVLYCGTEG